MLASGVGHLLVGEHSSDAAIGGSKHGQQAVPGGSGEVRSQACLLHGRARASGPMPASCPQAGCCLRVEILVMPHTLHQLLCDARVQDQVVQKEVVAWNGGQGWRRRLPVPPCHSPTNRSLPCDLAQALPLA